MQFRLFKTVCFDALKALIKWLIAIDTHTTLKSVVHSIMVQPYFFLLTTENIRKLNLSMLQRAIHTR